MVLYLAIRVINYLITLFVAVTIVFLVIHLMPGDPITHYFNYLAETYGGSTTFGDEIIAEYKAKFGFDKDLFTQYILYLNSIFLKFDFGPSFLNFPSPALNLIAMRLPWSIGLIMTSVLISWTMGIVAGAFLGSKRGKKFESVLYPFILVVSRIPEYLFGLLLVLTLGYFLEIFPRSGAFSAGLIPGLNLTFILDVMYHAFLPSLSFVLVSTFSWMITSRAVTISILGEDYLLYAQAKGLKNRRMFLRYILRNSLLPSITGLAMSLGMAVNGFYLIEVIFRYPGVGTLLALAVSSLDYNVIQGIVLISIVTVLTANLIIDTIYPLIDPRIKAGG